MNETILQCNRLHFSVAGRQQAIIAGLSLQLNQGDFMVLVGGNGSGKSSLLRLFNGRYTPSHGDIHFKQHALSDYKRNNLAKKIVTLNQSVADSLFVDLTVLENAIILDSRFKQAPAAKKTVLQDLQQQLHHYLPALSHALHTPVGHLSGGEQQVLALALYLRHKPDLLLLDEHTSALDPTMAEKIMQLTAQIIKEQRLTAVMTVHQPEFALQYGNRLLALRAGQVCLQLDNTEKAVLTKAELLAQCY